MEPIYIASVICFLAGASGYVIVRFWIIPIGKYRQLITQIKSDLAVFQEQARGKAPDKDAQKNLRQRATALTDLHDLDLPPWYRIILKQRGQSPLAASEGLMTLANTRNPDHIRSRIEQILGSLGF
jgi:hypothetical protein